MRKLVLLLLGSLFAYTQIIAQTRTVTGRVIDEQSEPIPNVSVQARPGDVGVATDAKGAFSISIPLSTKNLEFTAVGYARQIITIPETNNVTVVMKRADDELENVIITGYSREKRSEFAGAATKVGGDKIKNVPIGSFDQILQGRVPGLTVISTSGQPGSYASMYLRGATSIEGGSVPLFIIDGIPVEATVFQSLNPNDIESVDVLKDATAAALYGSRGAAGVIVVTTRRGSGGKAVLSYSGQYGKKFRPVSKYDMMNARELLQAQEDLGLLIPTSATTFGLPGWVLSKKNPDYINASAQDKARMDQMYDSLLSNETNWDDLIFRDGRFQNHELTLTGGSGKTRFFSNLSMYKEEGIIHRTDMKRLSFRNNLDYSDERLSLAVSTYIGYTKRNFQETDDQGTIGNPFLDTRITPSYIRPYNEDGSIAVGVQGFFAGPNQLDMLKYHKYYNDQAKVMLSANANYRITDHIYAGLLAGLDFRETQSTSYRDPQGWFAQSSSNIRTRSGAHAEGLNRFLTLNSRAFAGYKNSFNDVHEIDFTVYGELIQSYFKGFSFTGYGVDSKRPNTPAAITPGNAGNQLFSAVSGSKSEWAMSSLISTGRYTYDSKYTLNLTYRYDGVSSLPENQKFHGFYSVGAIWDVLREPFMNNVASADVLRLKLSYGESANAENFPLGNYGSRVLYDEGLYGDSTTIIPVTTGNAQADWEYTQVTNFGIDYSFFGNKLSGDLNLYNKTTKNLYLDQTLPATAGGQFSSIKVNSGSMRNRGVELTLNYNILRNQNMSWDVNFNGAYNENKIIDLGGMTSYPYGTSQITVGLPFASHYEVAWAGVDAATGKALYYTKDGKITDVYSDEDRVQTWGSSVPKYTGGFGTNFNFKGFEISGFFSFIAGVTRVNNLEFFMENPAFLLQGYNQAKSLNFWKQPGDIATTESPLYTIEFTSKYIQDASFLRFRNLTVAYNLPQNVLNKVKHISAVRVYLVGQNLHVWTNWKGYDPEISGNLALDDFPSPRAFTGGIEIRF
ncbi:MAG TPA: SusC/RagA family TonB-linked outer membrane protein [Parasegetibacter sp.]